MARSTLIFVAARSFQQIFQIFQIFPDLSVRSVTVARSGDHNNVAFTKHMKQWSFVSKNDWFHHILNVVTDQSGRQCSLNSMWPLKDASTHKNAQTHAGTVFCAS